MKKIYLAVLAVMALTCYMRGPAYAMPSSQIWIPSTDIQPFGTVHLGVDNYTTFFKSRKDGGQMRPVDVGVTLGVFETDFLNAELGVDLREATDNPTYFNAKLGIKEDAFTKYFPSIAFGGYDFGTTSSVNDSNIVYLEAAKTLGSFGRLTAGYYVGNDKLLKNAKGQKENDGILLSLDRTMAEISPKLWMAVDYMSGQNSYGKTSLGLSWRFSPHVSTLLGYCIHNEPKISGENMVTIQLDLDF